MLCFIVCVTALLFSRDSWEGGGGGPNGPKRPNFSLITKPWHVSELFVAILTLLVHIVSIPIRSKNALLQKKKLEARLHGGQRSI